MTHEEETRGREGMPLSAAIEGGKVSIAIGIHTLAFAFENSEANNPYDEDFCDTKRQFYISDPSQFAKDVCHELNRQGEDGSTPLTRFLDSVMSEAANQGSTGILDPDGGLEDDEDCFDCGGDGWIVDDCFEDTCCCLNPETQHGVIPCPTCNPKGDL